MPFSIPRFTSIAFAPARHVLEPLGHDDLRQDGRTGRAIPGNVVRLGRGFLEQLGAHVVERILELDLFGHCDAVMRDRGRTVFPVERHVAAFRSECSFDRIRDRIDAEL